MGPRITPPAPGRAHQHERQPTGTRGTRPLLLDRSRPLPDVYRGELGYREPTYAPASDYDREVRDRELLGYQTQRRVALARALLVVVAIAAVLVAAAVASSQRRPTDVELLARVVVHETGWEDTGDAEAIHAVLWPRMATVRREDGSLEVRPHPGWGAYVERCTAVMARVREVLAGERVHHCEREPHDWGGRVDRARARRLGLIEIDCSAGDVETVGDYYVRPSLLEER